MSYKIKLTTARNVCPIVVGDGVVDKYFGSFKIERLCQVKGSGSFNPLSPLEDGDYHITDFAFRDNTGEQPVDDDVMVIMKDHAGYERLLVASDVIWHMTPDKHHDRDFSWVSWKPCLKTLSAKEAVEESKKIKQEEQTVNEEIKTVEHGGFVYQLNHLYAGTFGEQVILLGKSDNNCLLVSKVGSEIQYLTHGLDPYTPPSIALGTVKEVMKLKVGQAYQFTFEGNKFMGILDEDGDLCIVAGQHYPADECKDILELVPKQE